MTNIYELPSIPESLRPDRTESEISFIAPVARKNYVVNPSFETDDIGETQPYNWSVGEYSYMVNQMLSRNSIGAVVSENVYSGMRAMRINLSDTDTSLVYGVKNPIVVPKESRKFVQVSPNKAYYTVRGALSFYAFAPAITGSSRFALFSQDVGTEHVIDVDIYATVDNNDLPNNTFNEQNIINSASVTLKVTESAYFTSETEPNVIGRRKNPEWQRYYVYFSVTYTPEEDTYLRFSIKNNTQLYDGNSFIFYLDAVQVEFFDDYLQRPTSYFDGDLGRGNTAENRGYYWDGAPRKSISIRTMEASTGGVLLNLQNDFGFQIVTINGLGLPQPENKIEPFMTADGQQYMGTGIEGRTITIVGTVTNDTFLGAFRKSGQLQYFLSQESSGISSTKRFYFRIPSNCNSPSEYVYFDAVINSINIDPLTYSPDVIMTIELNNIDVYFLSDNYAYTFDSVLFWPETLNRHDIVMFQAQGGSPIKDYGSYPSNVDIPYNDSYYGYWGYNLQINGAVLTWCELANGNIMFGGDFTKVTYIINGTPTTVNCNRVAILRDDGTVIPLRDYNLLSNTQKYNRFNGVMGTGAVVRSIIQLNDGSVVIGGRFDTVVGRNYDCLNIVFINEIDIAGRVRSEFRDVEGGLFATGSEQGVFTIAHDRNRNQLLVGGSFLRALKQSYTGASQLRNVAIYTIRAQNKWSQLHFGANGIVRTIAIDNWMAMLGGDFTAMYASSGTNLLTETKYACIYDLTPSTNFRVFSLSQIAQIAAVTTLPASTSAFDAPVQKIIKDSYGNIIIGGSFTKVFCNSNNLPSSNLQTLSASRIIRWDGFNRYTQMSTGLANNPQLFQYSLQINDICSSPYNDDVYAVGRFSSIGDISQAVCVARWSKNRWEALDFEVLVRRVNSVFISKRGYGFLSVVSNPESGTNRVYTPKPLIINNVGEQNQFVMELTNPVNNFREFSLISLYNVTTNKSITFNLNIAVGETITIDFSQPDIIPLSNLRSRVTNSVVGGGTFANFFLTEGVNVIKILGGHRYQNTFALPLKLLVGIRYRAKQISPYQIYETGIVRNKNLSTQWRLGASKLGIDTKVINNMQAQFPAFEWSSWGTWTLDRDILGDDTVINV